ncbi:hypothetical protein GINT2_000078 [Glugoides intestinalis]
MPLFVFGSNLMGQLGLSDNITTTNKPIEHEFFKNKKIVRIAAGKLHALALCENNELYSWGVNDDGALGRKGVEQVPGLVAFSYKVVEICCGASFSAVLTDKGHVFACGTFKSTSGVFGFDSKTKHQLEFKRIENVRGIRKIFAGHNHIIMIDKDNSLWTAGANESGQLGRPHRARHVKRCLEPSQISATTKKVVENQFVSAGGGEAHSFAINKKGECFGWGANFNGQLGIGESISDEKKRKVPLENVVEVACGATHTLFLTAEGILYGSGNNSLSQLGIEWTKMLSAPSVIFDGVEKIRTGCDFSIAEKEHKLLSWGSNINGELCFDELEIDEVRRPTEIDFNFGNIIDFCCGTDFVLVHTS